jgi:hypothetical protein
MNDDIMYRFIDVTGKCFESFQSLGENDGDKKYHGYIGALLKASHHNEHIFTVGDMMVFKDELIDAGFTWGKDFYVKKEELEQ